MADREAGGDGAGVNTFQFQVFESAGVPLRHLRAEVTHDAKLVRQLVNQWHSFKCAPQGWRVAFVLTDGIRLLGVSTFGRPVARLEDQKTTLEHTRMAVAPDAPRNSATRFMALTRAWIRENMPEITRLVSYIPADQYTGITYRGDGWEMVYEKKHASHTWTNRSGRGAHEDKIRTKFERTP